MSKKRALMGLEGYVFHLAGKVLGLFLPGEP